ncbi:hypothetical protein JR316_0003796 [Psilocybe cubensis]|uniref:Uncharacterized protein n=2 Tax=Psilocybe cubensis TaxID=181762 RepID=A0A8H7Y3E2_PSICU|nr:hypothetical protein JR316_0003796 [Psilocybe cubensis]KAH9484315.1 hypothetical protein JR316_0003796 [Psilocybe cubensis]
MQRLLQRLPYSSLRLVQTTKTLFRPCPNTLKFSSDNNARFITSPSHPAAGVLVETTTNTKGSTPEGRWKERAKDALHALNSPPHDEYTGRSVPATGKNLSATFRRLDQILIRNNVRQELRMGERHEKKGVKRRRLKSQRWHNWFANEVRQKVQLVNKIRKRGA